MGSATEIIVTISIGSVLLSLITYYIIDVLGSSTPYIPHDCTHRGCGDNIENPYDGKCVVCRLPVSYEAKEVKEMSENQWMVKNKTKGTWHNGQGSHGRTLNYETREEALHMAKGLAKNSPSDVFLVFGPYDEVKAVIPIEVTEWGHENE